MTGSNKTDPFGPDVPYDESDFGRCYRLLQHFPAWRARLPEVAAAHPIWGPMVEAWDELTALYEEEMQRSNSGSALKLNERIRELVDDGRRADGWEETRPGCWSSHKRKVLSMDSGASC